MSESEDNHRTYKQKYRNSEGMRELPYDVSNAKKTKTIYVNATKPFEDLIYYNLNSWDEQNFDDAKNKIIAEILKSDPNSTLDYSKIFPGLERREEAPVQKLNLPIILKEISKFLTLTEKPFFSLYASLYKFDREKHQIALNETKIKRIEELINNLKQLYLKVANRTPVENLKDQIKNISLTFAKDLFLTKNNLEKNILKNIKNFSKEVRQNKEEHRILRPERALKEFSKSQNNTNDNLRREWNEEASKITYALSRFQAEIKQIREGFSNTVAALETSKELPYEKRKKRLEISEDIQKDTLELLNTVKTLSDLGVPPTKAMVPNFYTVDDEKVVIDKKNVKILKEAVQKLEKICSPEPYKFTKGFFGGVKLKPETQQAVSIILKEHPNLSHICGFPGPEPFKKALFLNMEQKRAQKQKEESKSAFSRR